MPEYEEIEEQTEPPPMTVSAQDWEGPQTIDEARCFDSGFKAGLTAYAREKGESTLRSGNELLRRLMDEQGWSTIETFERLAKRIDEEVLQRAIVLTPEHADQDRQEKNHVE